MDLLLRVNIYYYAELSIDFDDCYIFSITALTISLLN